MIGIKFIRLALGIQIVNSANPEVLGINLIHRRQDMTEYSIGTHLEMVTK